MNRNNQLRSAEAAIAPTWPVIEGQAASSSCEEPARQSATHKFIRDVAFSNLPVPFQKLRTYLWLVVLTRALGPAGFGAWSLFVVTLSTATTVSTMNCGSSLMRFLSGERSRNEVNQAFSTVLAMVAGAGVIMAGVFAVFPRRIAGGIFGSVHASSLVVLLGVVLIFESAFEEMKNLLRARRFNQSWAYFCFARLLPETVAVIAIAWWLKSVNAAAFAYAVVTVCSVAGGMLYLKMRRKVRLVRPSMHLFSKYARYGLPLLPGVFASTVSLGADKYVVSYYLGLKQVGIYGACFALSALVFFLTGPINDVLFPELSALHDMERWAMFRQRFRSVQKFVFGFACGAAAILAAFSRQVLTIVAPAEFASGRATLAVLGVQGIFMALVLLYIVILNTRLRVWLTTWFWVLSGAAIILLDVVLIPPMGIVGAALSQLIATAGGALVLVVMHWDLFRETFDVAWLAQNGFAFAIVWLVAFACKGHPGSSALGLLQIAAGGAAFVMCLFVTGYLTLRNVAKLAKCIA
ncbi:MAG: oligosaccharide flippase family protein [Candidatus Acidiferrales bacterium]